MSLGDRMTEKRVRTTPMVSKTTKKNDRDDQNDMWSCPQHLIMTIGDTKNDRSAIYNRPLYLIIYIGDGEGNIEESGDGQWKTRRNGDDRWEMTQGQRRNTEG